MRSEAAHAQTLLDLVGQKAGDKVVSSFLDLGDAVVITRREQMFDLCKILKEDKELDFNMFLSVTAVDWMDVKEERFEMVYHFLSITKSFRLRIKFLVPEEDLTVPTLLPLWPSANFMEREVFDMFGVKFEGHPDLRRTLLYDEFVGHPLRKDYPVQAKQPRVPLRNPEVRNTSLDMSRPSLVSINKRRSSNYGVGA